jgi:hypothetical protein
MWIHVASTNNDPKVIAGYFVDCVKQIGGICRQHMQHLCQRDHFIAITNSLCRMSKNIKS